MTSYLVLTSDNFHSISSPSPPLLPSLVPGPPRWFLFETVIWCHLYRVFTYIYSLLIEKDLHEYWNGSVKFMCVYLSLSSGDLFIFSVWVSLFYSYFCYIRTWYFPSQYEGLYNYIIIVIIFNSIRSDKTTHYWSDTELKKECFFTIHKLKKDRSLVA